MLVLSAKLHERIYFEDSDTGRVGRVEVADIDKGKIRLGFTAGPDIRFWRASILSPHQLAEIESRLEHQKEAGSRGVAHS